MEKKEASKAKIASRPQPTNEETVRGVWIDGFGLAVSSDYILLDGIVAPPRSDKPYIVARLLFPPRMLEHLAKTFTEALQRQQDLKPPKVETKTETK